MKTKIQLLLLLLALNAFCSAASISITSIETSDYYRSDSFIITFNHPMQRIESDKIPISIKPALKCYWTWIDHKNLSCNLNDYSKDENEQPIFFKFQIWS
jgi:hypothetical protein